MGVLSPGGGVPEGLRGGSFRPALPRPRAPGPSLKEIEGPSYLPHLTLALGVGEEEAGRLLELLPPPPRGSFLVKEAALVKSDEEGDLAEVARFPLGPSPGRSLG